MKSITSKLRTRFNRIFRNKGISWKIKIAIPPFFSIELSSVKQEPKAANDNE